MTTTGATYLYPEEVTAITDAALRLERASNAARVNGTDQGTRIAFDQFVRVVRNVTERMTEDAA